MHFLISARGIPKSAEFRSTFQAFGLEAGEQVLFVAAGDEDVERFVKFSAFLGWFLLHQAGDAGLPGCVQLGSLDGGEAARFWNLDYGFQSHQVAGIVRGFAVAVVVFLAVGVQAGFVDQGGAAALDDGQRPRAFAFFSSFPGSASGWERGNARGWWSWFAVPHI